MSKKPPHTSPYVSNCLPNDFFPVPPNPNPCLSVPTNEWNLYKLNHTVWSTCKETDVKHRWFSITWQDGHLGAQNNGTLWLMLCIIIESTSQKTFCSLVLCSYMARMIWKPPTDSTLCHYHNFPRAKIYMQEYYYYTSNHSQNLHSRVVGVIEFQNEILSIILVSFNFMIEQLNY